MSRRILLAAFAALACTAVLLAGCAPARTGSTGTTPSVPATGAAEATSGAATSTAPVNATIETGKGTIRLELYPAKAPLTVANFVKLADAKFYDGIRIHRVEPGFVVQAGDPLTKGLSAKELRGVIERQRSNTIRPDDPPIGTGGPGWSIPLEISDLVHDRGVIAMARSQDPNSGGSQFYITLDAVHQLDGGYAVFGRVTAGMDVVDKLSVGDEIRSVRIGD
jgi:cyclophilin family peptidyl-prolyl cis-trans isomerase